MAKPILRGGEEPEIMNMSCFEDGVRKVRDKVYIIVKKGYKTFGILAKTRKECRRIYDALKAIPDIKVKHIGSDGDSIGEEVSIMLIHLSKGLEFDAAILWDASNNNYTSDDFDRKLLYIGATRALHYLYILYTDKPSELLLKV